MTADGSAVESVEWVAGRPDRIVRLEERGPGRYGFEAVEFGRDRFEAALGGVAMEAASTIDVRYDGWKVAVLRRYRPLVHYCAFADPEVFNCLELSIRSLVEIGGYRHEIAVTTSPEDAPRIEALRDRLELGGRLHVVTVDAHADLVDFTLARFRLDDPVFEGRQPLVYMDCDIVVDAKVEPLLMRVAGSERIHVAPEGRLDEGHPDSAGHWFGWRMMAADGMAFDPGEPGFSDGFMAAGSAVLARRWGKRILEVAARFQEACGERQPFLGYDQCVANYVLLKAGIRSFKFVREAVVLFRIRAEAPPAWSGRGCVHFLNADAAGKRAAMAAFLDTLSEHGGETVGRAAPPAG